MSGQTAGPWHVEVEQWRGVFSGKPFVLHHIRTETDLVAKVFSGEGDAILFALAPELLEAARRVHEAFNDHPWQDDKGGRLDALEAIIAKAEAGQ